jgi:hypothetical protein|tara:strand:- start:242 stop:934 length:693 start_codon:yes stop_codon:yes gene_type:complete
MNKSDLSFFLNENVQIELSSFVLSLLSAAVLSFIVHLFYIKFSSTLSNRSEFSKNFVILGVATTIIIVIVKSSLALSLGLVGALSIVRFRAAIKEPEELIYLFLIIAIGLGCGANQLIITAVGIIFSLTVIILFSIYQKKSRTIYSEKLNLGIITNENITDQDINKIIEKVTSITFEAKLISMSRTEKNTTINIDLKTENLEHLTKLTEEIKKEYPKSQTILTDNNDLSM